MRTPIRSYTAQALIFRAFLVGMMYLLFAPVSVFAAETVKGFDLSTAIVQVAKQTIPAVAHIEVTQSQEVANPLLPFSTDPFFRRFFNVPQMPKKFKREMKGLGTGMIIDGQDVFADNKYEDRSPVNTDWVLAVMQKGNQQHAQRCPDLFIQAPLLTAEQESEGPSGYLAGRVTEDPLCSRVGEFDHPLEVDDCDGIDHLDAYGIGAGLFGSSGPGFFPSGRYAFDGARRFFRRVGF